MNFPKMNKHLNKMRHDTVYLMQFSTVKQGYDKVQKWEHTGALKCNLQSYNGGLAAQEYGLTVEAVKQLFCEPGAAIVEAMGVALSADASAPDFIVEYVEPNKSHTMALLKKAV